MSRKLSPEEREYMVLVSNLRELAKAKAGQEVLWHVLGFCDLYADIGCDIDRAMYYEGKRAVGLQILAFLEDADPTLYARLLLTKQQQKGFLNDDTYAGSNSASNDTSSDSGDADTAD